jgi:hypothetical protein
MRLLGLLALLLPLHALAARVEIPLRLSLDTLRAALGAQLAATPYRDGPCRYLKLGEPKLESIDGRLRLSAPGRGVLGVPSAGQCQAAVWRGTLHVTLVPQLDGAGQLRLRIVDSRMVDARGGAAPLLWELGKRHIHPRLERFSYGVDTSLLRSFAPAMDPLLRQIQFLPPRVASGHIDLPVAFDVPDAWLTAPPASSAPLTEAEMDALEKALEPWDAFLVYVVRHVALAGGDEQLRKRLFDLLIDSRHRLVELLSGDARAQGDPARALFLDTWSELREILAGRYALFADAADALAAFEAAAPGAPLSTGALRQLARGLAPGASGDPLAYDWNVDPELGRVFQVEEIGEVDAEPAPPPATSWLDFLVRPARADGAPERWIPTREQLAAYETRVGGLLRKTSAGELERTALPQPYGRMYRDLVPTTALIESCWRQYAMRGGKVSYLRSHSGSVGIMQINQRVWRGFYDIERVRWDTAYNMRAGAQILLRYLTDYAIPYAEKTGKPEDAARAAYAVYNAGPRAVARFAKSPPHPREARVDEKLLTLYRGIASGEQVDLANCSVRSAVALKKP